MNSLFKFLGLATLIVLAGLWIMTVSKSCNKNKLDQVTTLEDELKDKATEVTDDAETLFEGETEEEGLFNEEGDEITSTSTGTGSTTKPTTTTTNTTSVDEDDEEEATTDLQKETAARGNATDEEATSSTTTSQGASVEGLEYLVIGGAFLTEANAKIEVKKLQKKGYPNAEVLVFDFSKYYSVCVERTESNSTAIATKAKLIKEGHKEAYVHKKRSYKKK